MMTIYTDLLKYFFENLIVTEKSEIFSKKLTGLKDKRNILTLTEETQGMIHAIEAASGISIDDSCLVAGVIWPHTIVEYQIFPV